MDNFVILHKSADGSYNIEGNERAVDIQLLAETYPHTQFIVKNNNKALGLDNVFTKSDIMEACNMDDKLQIRCPSCSTKNRYNRAVCRNCDDQIPYHDILLKTFGESYSKAVMTVQVDNQFGQLSDKKFGKAAFNPYDTNQVRNDPFLQTLSAAFFRS